MIENVEVRTGTPDDIDGMMAWAGAAAQDNAIIHADQAKVLQLIWAALNCQGGIVGIIGQPGEIIEGAVILTVGPLWYSEETVLEERVVFVRPEFRAAKGGRARKLIGFAKKAAQSLGLPLAIGVLSNEKTAAKVRLYQREFGEPAGVYFLWNGKTGLEEASVDQPELALETA